MHLAVARIRIYCAEGWSTQPQRNSYVIGVWVCRCLTNMSLYLEVFDIWLKEGETQGLGSSPKEKSRTMAWRNAYDVIPGWKHQSAKLEFTLFLQFKKYLADKLSLHKLRWQEVRLFKFVSITHSDFYDLKSVWWQKIYFSPFKSCFPHSQLNH